MKIENQSIINCESKLKKMRLASGLKQKEVSQLTGINVKTICQYEQDPAKINKASIETIAKISDAIGCDMMDIIETKLLNK